MIFFQSGTERQKTAIVHSIHAGLFNTGPTLTTHSHSKIMHVSTYEETIYVKEWTKTKKLTIYFRARRNQTSWK
jgi:hypothetical protein